jgi:hypothetical protein
MLKQLRTAASSSVIFTLQACQLATTVPSLREFSRSLYSLYIPVSIHTGVYTYRCLYIAMSIHTGVYTYRYLYIPVAIHTGIYTYRCLYIPVSIHTGVYTYRCLYIPMSIHTGVYTYRCLLLKGTNSCSENLKAFDVKQFPKVIEMFTGRQ